MLVRLDESLKDLDINNNTHIIALETILISSFDGNHFFLASFPVIDAISVATRKLGTKSKAAIKRLRSNVTYSGSIKDTIPVTMSIVLHGSAASFDGTMWIAPLKLFTDSSTMERPVLLCEHDSDATILIHAARHYLIKCKLPSIRCNVFPRGGGGTNISNEFDNLINRDNKSCLCITDSDQHCPGCKKGDNSKACESISNSRKWINRHIPLPAREIENMIPENIWAAALDNDPRMSHLTELQNLVKTGIDKTIINHLDFKNGTSIQWILKDNSVEHISYWKPIIQKLRLPNHIDRSCIEDWRCNDKTCACYTISGLGENCLGSAIQFLNEKAPHKTCNAVSGWNSDSWLLIGADVLAWVCADKPISI